MQIKPKLPSTRITGIGCEWFPENFTTFQEELNHIVSYGRHANRFFLFRGQKNYEWLLDSIIARSIKKILDVDPPYKLASHIQCLPWVNTLFGWLLIYKFRVRTQPSE
jgi:hypothetical protein